MMGLIIIFSNIVMRCQIKDTLIHLCSHIQEETNGLACTCFAVNISLDFRLLWLFNFINT